MDRILVLYTEYAPYLHACFRKLTGLFDYEVHVVRYPLDKNAPFEFEQTEGIKFYDRRSLTIENLFSLCRTIEPCCIIVSGWVDKAYNRVISSMKKDGILVVGVIDNQWTGTWKQKIFTKLGRYFIQRHFTMLWVPGTTQYEYMRRSAVTADKIMVGYYSADSDLYLSRYKQITSFPKRFIYVGRLLDIKGAPVLLDAIEQLYTESRCDWEFVIIGSGEHQQRAQALSEKFTNVIYKPFMQPHDLIRETAGGGVFVLPSNYDAWGLVVHEYALMGFPLVLSSMVGSRFYFVTPGYNGYVFQSGSVDSLVYALQKIMKLDETTLLAMSERSHTIGRTINTDGWATRLHECIRSYKHSRT